MPSSIVRGVPATQSPMASLPLSSNFGIAADEITQLQSGKQDTLVSGVSIRTVNGQNLLGSGNIEIQGGGGGGGGGGGSAFTEPVTVNTSGGTMLPMPTATALQLAGPVTGSVAEQSTMLTIDASGFANLMMRRAKGSFTAPAALAQSDALGVITMQGSTGSGFATGMIIQALALQGWNPGSCPTQLEFYTARAGSSAPSRAFFVGATGGFVVGTPSGGDQGANTLNVQNLYVGEDIHLNGQIYVQGEPVMMVGRTRTMTEVIQHVSELEERVKTLEEHH